MHFGKNQVYRGPREDQPRPRAVERLRVHVDTPATDNKEDNLSVVKFKGNTYSLKKLLKQAGPQIEFDKDQLHPDYKTLTVCEGEIDWMAHHKGAPIFAKYEGKYVPVLGYLTVFDLATEGKVIKGKLLANPVLKNAVVA